MFKLKWLMLIVIIVVIGSFAALNLRSYLSNQKRSTELNAKLDSELKLLDSIGGLTTATPTGGVRIILPIKALTRDWLIATENSLMLNMAKKIQLCGNSDAPIVSEAKKMKWYSNVEIEFVAKCP